MSVCTFYLKSCCYLRQSAPVSRAPLRVQLEGNVSQRAQGAHNLITDNILIKMWTFWPKNQRFDRFWHQIWNFNDGSLEPSSLLSSVLARFLDLQEEELRLAGVGDLQIYFSINFEWQILFFDYDSCLILCMCAATLTPWEHHSQKRDKNSHPNKL